LTKQVGDGVREWPRVAEIGRIQQPQFLRQVLVLPAPKHSYYRAAKEKGMLPFSTHVGRRERGRTSDKNQSLASVDFVSDLLRERQPPVRHAFAVVPDIEPFDHQAIEKLPANGSSSVRP